MASLHGGKLCVLDPDKGIITAERLMLSGRDCVIGRDRSRCQWTIDDPRLSGNHLRIYSIVPKNEDKEKRRILTYAEDLSRNGTFWNGSLIDKGKGGFLLSHNDTLRLSSSTILLYLAPECESKRLCLSYIQEREMTYFKGEYTVTDRLLTAGVSYSSFMAVQQQTKTQVACKTVDLSRLKNVSGCLLSSKTPTPAQSFDQRGQTRKVKIWGEQKRKGQTIEDYLKNSFREADILTQLTHPNIVGLYKVYVTDSTIYVFQDLIAAGNLVSYLESKNGRLSETETAVVVRQVLVALQFLHSQHIVHRDLKPENIMINDLSSGSRVVLTDFSMARRTKVDSRSILMAETRTRESAALGLKRADVMLPEIKTGNATAIDMQGLGAITVLLLIGTFTLPSSTLKKCSPALIRRYSINLSTCPREWEHIKPLARDFATNLIFSDETQCMTAAQAIKHDWFSNDEHCIDFEDLYQRSVRDWRPSVTKSPVVEFFQADHAKFYPASQLILGGQKRSRPKELPIDPPYKPFPRSMHIQLWPKRKLTDRVMSDEVKKAIEMYWKGEWAKNVRCQRPLTRRLEHFTFTTPRSCAMSQFPDTQSHRTQIQQTVNHSYSSSQTRIPQDLPGRSLRRTASNVSQGVAPSLIRQSRGILRPRSLEQPPSQRRIHSHLGNHRQDSVFDMGNDEEDGFSNKIKDTDDVTDTRLKIPRFAEPRPPDVWKDAGPVVAHNAKALLTDTEEIHE